MKVLITGVSGMVGPGVVRALAGKHELRLLDLVRKDELAGYEWAVGSILDAKFLADAVKGVDAVVHMVRVCKVSLPGPTTADFFDVNVKGTYLVLEAAASEGIKRFVHVSSTAPVIGHWYEGRDITVDSPLTTTGRYSLTKAIQETICEHFSRNSDMRVTVLRPWMPREADEVRRQASGQDAYKAGLIDTEDFGRACLAAIEKDDLGKFEIFHCVATAEARRRFDAERTDRILGWRAKDDFADLAPEK